MPRTDPVVETTAKRLVRLAAHIEADTWADGARWYDRESAWIARTAQARGVPTTRAIAAYAALSPRVQVGRNRYAAAAVMDGVWPQGFFHRSVRAALSALAGDFGPHVCGVGPKVWNFANALAGDPDAVTVDIWAARAAGLPAPKTPRQYGLSVNAYRLAAGRLGVDTRTLQAATWLYVRGTKPQDEREA